MQPLLFLYCENELENVLDISRSAVFEGDTDEVYFTI